MTPVSKGLDVDLIGKPVIIQTFLYEGYSDEVGPDGRQIDVESLTKFVGTLQYFIFEDDNIVFQLVGMDEARIIDRTQRHLEVYALRQMTVGHL